MKKIYKKPSTEFVVVRCNEKLMWGEMGTESNTETHTNSKKQDFFEEDDTEFAPTDKSSWDDEKSWE